jgi:hypothetical protein
MTAEEELAAICAVVGCQQKPGVALRFVSELRRDNQRSYERQVELLRTWEDASPTERQELDRLRRGWGPSTPTERQARRDDVIIAMHAVEHAMADITPADDDGDDVAGRLNAAYERLRMSHIKLCDLLLAIPALSAPDLPEQPRD